jgi:hypothetical protein
VRTFREVVATLLGLCKRAAELTKAELAKQVKQSWQSK